MSGGDGHGRAVCAVLLVGRIDFYSSSWIARPREPGSRDNSALYDLWIPVLVFDESQDDGVSIHPLRASYSLNSQFAERLPISLLTPNSRPAPRMKAIISANRVSASCGIEFCVGSVK